MLSSIEPHSGWHVVLVLCSVVRRCATACIVAGGASDIRVRACVRVGCIGHTVGLWLRCDLPPRNDRLRGASSPHLPPTSGQVLCSTAAGVYKLIMPSSGIRNRVRVRGFFHESVRNRPLTKF